VTERKVVLLGPQAPQPIVGAVVEELVGRAPVAVITAGWQEWESDLAGLYSQLGDRMVSLRLYERAEAIWARDTDLREEHRRAQRDLRAIRERYAGQLERAAEAWMELLRDDGPEHIVQPERDAALAAIQRLDAHHVRRIEEVKADFRERTKLTRRPAVVRARDAVLRDLEGTEAVVIEGGHAAVLHNRITLFDLVDELRQRIVVGCAAGAMVVCSRVVLYNDSPAIGRGNAEVGLPGLGLIQGVVALPDAAHRLRIDDVRRMRRLALRLAPDRCALLDAGDRLDFLGDVPSGRGSRLIHPDGTLSPWVAAA